MRHAIATLSTVIVCLALTSARTLAHQAKELGDALGDAPDALLWNFKVLYLLPRNLADYNKAFQVEQDKLGAGDSKRFNVIFTMSGEDPLRFVQLVPAEENPLLPEDQRAVATVTIDKTRYAIRSPGLPFDKSDFERSLGRQFPNVTYVDHEHVVSIWNAQNGFAPDDGPLSKVVDLLDRTARCGADGQVILVADEKQSKYSIFNSQSQKAETATKGESLKASGNSVWVLARFPDGLEYTLVYRQLASKPTINVGEAVKAGAVLGDYARENGARLEVWRVSGPTQFFLRNGAKRVAPLAP